MTEEEWNDLMFYGFWVSEEKRRRHNLIPFEPTLLLRRQSERPPDPKTNLPTTPRSVPLVRKQI